jgi:S1-C subfamily serine protease
MTPAGPTVVSRAEPGPGDLAVLQLLPTGARLPHLPLAEDGPPAPLDEVLALGFPLSRLEDGRAVPQVTLGRVRRSGGPMLELDGALHPGNSGGPILDLRGRVLGMASAILDSPVYGIAVRAAALRAALRAARERTADLQRSLRALGCDPGAADGRLGPRTLQAERCAAALH